MYRNRTLKTGRLAITICLVAAGTAQSLAQGFPIPGPGETVTWTTAMNPIVITGLVVIPGEGTVVVEPGVVINASSNSTLQIEGTLLGRGTAAEPITITGGQFQFSPAVRVVGTLDLEFAEASGRLHGRSRGSGSMLLTRCSFTQAGVSTVGPFMRIEQCSFTDGAGVHLENTTLAILDSSIQGQSPTPPGVDDRLSIHNGYLYLDNVTLDGSQFAFVGAGFAQPAYINNLAVRNNVDVGGLELWDGNYFCGSNVVVENNLYTAELWGAGVVPGSTLPPSGNVNNYLLNEGDGDRNGRLIWGDAGVPYVVTGGYAQRGGSIDIRPGTTVKLGPNAGMRADPALIEARGRPDAPVTFERLDPTRSWHSLDLFTHLENCVIDGATVGARFSSGNVAGPGSVDNSVISNCEFGTQNSAYIRKTRFINNATGVWGNGIPSDLDGSTNPNSFVGNTLAVEAADDARFNWWGDASGPSGTQNPGGAGDPVNFGIPIDPFLTSPPNFGDNPPIVQLNEPYVIAAVGAQLLVGWEATDDGAIVLQRVLFKPRSGGQFQVVADNLPGSQRSVEIIVPDIPRTSLNGPAFIRVEAVDDAGQVGWDQGSADVPWPTSNPGTLTVTSDLTGPFLPGERVPLCWSVGGGVSATLGAILLLDGDSAAISLGGAHTGVSCLPIGMRMPFVSTDTARVALVLNLTTNERKYFFSNYFSIRPDSRIGDEPPDVQLLTPQAGQRVAAGSLLPISWTASDDEALRSFTIQASYDAGRTWQIIADNLPAGATSFDWRVPAGDGVVDARIRVIARDLRFQNSSAGTNRSFSITPGGGGVPGDLNGDGHVDLADLGILLADFGCMPPGPCVGDVDGDGDTDLADLGILLANFGA